MKGYWNNDSLMFIGRNGVTYGYQNTLMNYKKNYPNTGNPVIGNASQYCAARYQHSGGSVYLLADGHAKWYRGPATSWLPFRPVAIRRMWSPRSARHGRAACPLSVSRVAQAGA